MLLFLKEIGEKKLKFWYNSYVKINLNFKDPTNVFPQTLRRDH